MKALMTQARLLIWLPATVLAACVVQSSKPPIQGGSGVDVSSTGTVSLNTTDVPLLPSSCKAGQVVGHSDAGWDCVDLTYSQINGTPPVSWTNIEGSVTTTTAWPGTVPYSAVTSAPPVDWATVSSSVTGTTAWPGTIPYAEVTSAPAVDWTTVSSSVTSSTAWPGTIPYAEVTSAPAVDWTTVSSSVTNTTAWPGTVPYSELTGVTATTVWPGTVPYTRITSAPAVDWTTVGSTVTSTTAWPGTVPYSELTGTTSSAWPGTIPYAQVTSAPAVDWTTVSSTVTGSTAWPGTVPYTHITSAPSITFTAGSVVTQTAVITGTLGNLAANATITLRLKTLAQNGLGTIGVVTGTLFIGPITPTSQTSEAVIQVTTSNTGTATFSYNVTDTTSPDSVWTEVLVDSGSLTAGAPLSY